MKKYYFPKFIEVTFPLRNARDNTTYIQPDSILLGSTPLSFTYSNNLITCTIPTTEMFSLTFNATGYRAQTYINLQGFYLNNFNGFTLYPIITEFGAQVKWNISSVSDLDTHIVVRRSGETVNQGEVNYTNRGKVIDIDGSKIILDTDDTGQGSGETVTFVQQNPNHTYYFIIYDFTGRSTTNSVNITNSNAFYNIFIPGNVNPITINVPQNSPGRFWEVFSMVGGSNMITQLNRIVDTNTYNIQNT